MSQGFATLKTPAGEAGCCVTKTSNSERVYLRIDHILSDHNIILDFSREEFIRVISEELGQAH